MNADLILHYAMDGKSCYEGSCKGDISRYYGSEDNTIDETPISDCVAYFYQRPANPSSYLPTYPIVAIHNKKHSDSLGGKWGNCRLFDYAYQRDNLGYRLPSAMMRTNNDLLQVGLKSCHEAKVNNEWCDNCKGNILTKFPSYNYII